SLDLEPYGSRFVVFSRRASASSAGESSTSAVLSAAPSVPAAIDLSENWNIRFEGAPETFSLKSLASWTEREETRHFSGVASYEKKFEVPEQFVNAGLRVQLELGSGSPIGAGDEPKTEGSGMRAMLESPVREAAVVYVNDLKAGSVWCPPYSIEVTKLL